MAAYGSLWPYAVAIPLRTFGLTYLTYTVTMASLTAAALLALFATLVRVTRRAAFALALYLPILGVSFWLLHGTLTARYAPGTYYGMFPLRYAGPALLALLTAVYVGRAPRPRASTALLFAAAGLVALNNLDFGVPAAGATVGAVAIGTRPWTRRALARLAGDAGLGLLAALAAVSLLTLVRAGTLPHLGLLLRYGHYFVVGGTGNVPLAPLGLHVAITLTFLAALATAVVGGVARERDVVLDGMLAWSGLFGLGAGIYYYAYRSHPYVLVNLFPIWAFALALLIVAIVREAIAGRRRVGLPALAVLFAFALVASSLAQAPAPWDQVRRIRAQLPPPAKPWFPSEGFRGSAVRRIVAERTRPHERILLLSPMGHRIAEEVGVVNVAPYPGLGQMPAREQLGESLRMLRDEGGDAVFVSDRTPPEADEYLRRRGFTRVGVWTGLHGWPVSFLEEYRR